MALVQLLIYVSSVSVSFFLTKIYSKLGRKNSLLVGGIFCVGGAVSMIFLTPQVTWPIYLIAIVIGTAQSMTLSTGINMIS
jgi:Na+/melibiose symporter-like transporter